MPTGYTAKIHEGKEITAKEFILDCSRAFGALIMMRDEPMDAQIPERFEPNTYSLEQANSCKFELDRLQLQSDDEAKEEFEAWYTTKCDNEFRRYQESVKLSERYLAVIEKVEKWQPPTVEHAGLKEFCLKQLRDSWNSDCYHNRKGYAAPNKPEFENWKSDRIESMKREIEYYEKSYQEEVERTESRNQWIAQLRGSLEGFEL